jgi:hypothetical protein
MGQISLADVRAGMVLRAAALAPEGRLLLEAGTGLTESHLRVLSMWGVAQVDVEGVSRADLAERAVAELAPVTRAGVDRRVQALFRHNDPSDPVIDELLQLATMRLVQRARGETGGS